MLTTRTLPASYREAGTLDLTKDRRLLLVLNLFGLVMFGLAGFLFFRVIVWLRPPGAPGAVWTVQVETLPDILVMVLVLLALTAFHIILHEAIHGVFFWWFTRSRPRFAFHWTYAYASAPGWYLPRIPFLVTTLAPLVLISLVGLVVFRFAPAAWLLPTWFILTMNASGAIGDLLVFVRLVGLPPAALIQDRGDAVAFFVMDELVG